MVLQFLSTIIVFVKYKHGVIDSPVIIVKCNSVVYTYFRSIDIGDVASSVLLKILITLDDKTDAEALALANKILERIENGEDFDSLIQKYGKDLYMFNNDDGYYVCRGTLHEAFEEAAFSIDVGEVSGIVKTDAGYSIIKRYEKEESYLKEHFDELAENYITSCYNLALEKREDELTVTDTKELQNYSIFNLSMTAED